MILSVFFCACDHDDHKHPAGDRHENQKQEKHKNEGCSHGKKEKHENEGCSHGKQEKHEHEADSHGKKEKHEHEECSHGKQEKHEHEGCSHGKQKKHEHEAESHGKGRKESCDGHNHSHGKVSLNEAEEKKCSHGITFIECDECRGELGIVKLMPDVEKELIESAKVQKSLIQYKLNLVGEVKINLLKTVIVTPIVSGRVKQVYKSLGDKVKKGELLAILQSKDYGKAKLDYISTLRLYDIVKKRKEWIDFSHKNLMKLMKRLKREKGSVNFKKYISKLKIGKNKEFLIKAATNYHLSLQKYKREKQVIKNLKSLLSLMKQKNGAEKIKNLLEKWKIGSWKGKLFQAAASLRLAKKNYERERTLMKNNASTQKEFQEAESNYQKRKADYQALLEEASLWTQQKAQEIKTELNSVQAQYESKVEEIEIDLKLHQMEIEQRYNEALYKKANAKKQLYLLGMNEKDIQNLEKQNSLQLGLLELRAPISGTIISFQISEGQFVTSQTALYKISDLSKLWVWCDVYEHDFGKLQAFRKNPKTLEAKVIFSQSKHLFGTVDYISNTMDEKSRTVKLRVVVENFDQKITPGRFVKVSIQIPAQKTVLTVPKDSVFSDESQHFVFKKWKRFYWVRKNILVGPHINNRRIIYQGISEKDTIVTRGGFMLKSEVLKKTKWALVELINSCESFSQFILS